MNKEGKLLTIPLYSIYFQNQTSTFQCWCILIIIHFRFLFFNISEIQDVTCEHSFQASVVVMIFTTIKKLNIIIYRKWCSEEIYGKVIVVLRIWDLKMTTGRCAPHSLQTGMESRIVLSLVLTVLLSLGVWRGACLKWNAGNLMMVIYTLTVNSRIDFQVCYFSS